MGAPNSTHPAVERNTTEFRCPSRGESVSHPGL